MSTTDTRAKLTQEQRDELLRLRQYFPFRLVWGSLDPFGGRWTAHATTDKREMNAMIRKGWTVVLLQQRTTKRAADGATTCAKCGAEVEDTDAACPACLASL